MGKKVGSLGDSAAMDVILIGGGVAALYFFVIKPILDGLGGADSVYNAEMALPPSQNPFNYQFQPFNDFYSQNAPQALEIDGGGGALSWLESLFGPTASSTTINNPTPQQFFQALKASPPTQSPWGFLDVPTLCQWAESIYGSTNVAWWNPLATTDQQSVVSAVSNFSNQLQVAFVANYLWWNYNVGMLPYLKGSLTKSGLTPANIDQLINQVNSLPVNPS